MKLMSDALSESCRFVIKPALPGVFGFVFDPLQAGLRCFLTCEYRYFK